MAKTNYARNKIQDFLYGGISFTPPATYYLGLSTTTPSVSGSNITEPVGASYARVALTNNKSTFTYSSSGCVVNAATISFPETSGSQGVITNLVLFDASTSGSAWDFMTLPIPKTVQDATVITISASAIALSLS